VKDLAGNALSADVSWSFTTQAIPSDEGPGGPILVISTASNPFSRYYAEILRTEGLNEFTVTDISKVDSTLLNTYQVVILGEMALTPSQVTMLTTWVDAGGNLIAMRPDPQLASLLGLTDTAPTLSNAYLLVNTASGPGVGIVNQTIQFHGEADLYTLNGATALATLYSDATNSTLDSNPAVTIINVGSNSGQAAAFTYDLAKSIVYTRQGNPAWVDTNGDGSPGPVRADDLFHHGTGFTDWVNLNKVAIPQADEQQRLLANMILSMNMDRTPLPRFWYFPRDEKAVVLLTSDDHASANVPARLEQYKAASTTGCSVTDWECIRASIYIYPDTSLTTTQATEYTSKGFEIGVHINTDCANYTVGSLTGYYTNQLSAFAARFPGLPLQASERTHCIAWSGWAMQPLVKAQQGIRLDTNYYYWPQAWINNRPGMFTGSGMPMRFTDLDGTIIDVFQATTQMTDESGQTYPSTIDSLLDKAMGAEGYYGVFTANMHTDSLDSPGANAIIASAQPRGVPVVSGRQLLTWLDGRNASSFTGLSWNSTTKALSFTVNAGAGANGLRAMLPVQGSTGPLQSLTHGATGNVTTTPTTIKGVEYAIFDAAEGSYVATYDADTTDPVISAVSATVNSDGTATITWTTDEPSTSHVDYGTTSALGQSANNSALVTSHSITLFGLTPNTIYYYRVSSTDAANNSATSPVAPGTLTFTTPSIPLGDDTAADFALSTLGTCVADGSIGDGALRLPSTIDEAFSGSTLPPEWTANVWSGGSTPSVASGLLTLNGSEAYTDATFGPGKTLEFSATFGAQANQHIGFGVSSGSPPAPYNDPPWIMFSTYTSTSRLSVRVNDTSIDVGAIDGSPHTYRIDWKTDSIDFYVDATKTTVTATISTPMHVAASDLSFDSPALTIDWLRMSPYTSPCTFTSRVFDAGSKVNWQALTWTAGLPAGTSLAFSYRVGNSATPADTSWSSFIDVATSGSPLTTRSQYAQYRVILTTTDGSVTPNVQDVYFTYTTGSDTTAPTILSRSPDISATGVALDSNVSITFSELLALATVDGTNVYLQKVGIGTNIAAGVSLSGNNITLDPTDPLIAGTQYTVTVKASVADMEGNPLGADNTWNFTTVPASIIDTTAANFSGGSGTCAVDASIGDGAVRLPAALDEGFPGTALPATWSPGIWETGGTTTVANGALTVDGARAYSNLTFGPGHSLEFRATFTAANFQNIGLAADGSFTSPWIVIGEGTATDGVYARMDDNTSILLSKTTLGSPTNYRIDWTTSGFDFYVGGTKVTSVTRAIAANMLVMVSDINTGGGNLSVDWLKVTPLYAYPCTFTSRSIDVGQTVDWLDLEYSASPIGTTLSFETRSSLDNTNWSNWQTVNSPIASINGRYIQYRTTLSSSDPNLTPTLNDVTISYGQVNPTAANLNYFHAARDPAGVLLSWETVSEATTAGFNLYRREPSGEFLKVNDTLIPPQAGGQPQGASYTYLDADVAPDQLYEFKLEIIETSLAVSARILVTYWPFSVSLPFVGR